MSDEAAEFTGQVISELCDLLALSSTDQWYCRKSTSNPQENDSQDGPRQKSQMALTFRAYTGCLQCNKVTDNRLLALLPHVQGLTKITSQPSIPNHYAG